MTREEGEALLKIARSAIERELGKESDAVSAKAPPELLRKQGAFVTLRKEGMLRGCIGRIEATEPLIQTVSQMAFEAAFHDPRFPPLEQEELSGVLLEVSVLSPLKKIQNIQEIRLGKDGLLIRKGPHVGLLLPQVASEQKWGLETFLSHTCLKAGLRPETWKDKETEIFTFTAEIFSEKPSR